jgi:hypothetical protein
MRIEAWWWWMLVVVVVVSMATSDHHHRYLNSFAIEVDGGLEQAKAVAMELGFELYREVSHMTYYIILFWHF